VLLHRYFPEFVVHIDQLQQYNTKEFVLLLPFFYTEPFVCHKDPLSYLRHGQMNPMNKRIKRIHGMTMNRLNCDKDRKSTRLNSSHVSISYAVFCVKKKNNIQ